MNQINRGQLPSVITEHKYLQFLSVFNNSFDGGIPPSIKNLTKVFHLDLSINNFTGPLPEFLGEMPELSYLFLSNNKFDSGPIPPNYANLQYMEELSLKGTNRNGTIPSFIGNYTRLKLLDLDNNNFRYALCSSNDSVPLIRLSSHLCALLPFLFPHLTVDLSQVVLVT